MVTLNFNANYGTATPDTLGGPAQTGVLVENSSAAYPLVPTTAESSSSLSGPHRTSHHRDPRHLAPHHHKLVVRSLTGVVSALEDETGKSKAHDGRRSRGWDEPNTGSLGRILFENLEFQVCPGEIAFITGRSGRGKSFLLRCIAGLDQACAGTITLGDVELSSSNPSEWRQRVMYIPATLPSYLGTASELYDRFRKFRTNMPGREINPQTIGNRLSVRFELWKTPWEQLSTGERHRIFMAIALSLQPEVMLLDEGLSPLDASTSGLVETELKRHSSMAIIWATHNLKLLNRFHYVAHIELGK